MHCPSLLSTTIVTLALIIISIHHSIFFFFNDTATTEIYTLSYTTLFRARRAAARRSRVRGGSRAHRAPRDQASGHRRGTRGALAPSHRGGDRRRGAQNPGARARPGGAANGRLITASQSSQSLSVSLRGRYLLVRYWKSLLARASSSYLRPLESIRLISSCQPFFWNHV